MGVAKEAPIFWILVKLEVPGALGHTDQSRSVCDADSTLVPRNIVPPSCSFLWLSLKQIPGQLVCLYSLTGQLPPHTHTHPVLGNFM